MDYEQFVLEYLAHYEYSEIVDMLIEKGVPSGEADALVQKHYWKKYESCVASDDELK